MHSLLDGPIREAARVYLNGSYVGSLWHPPYELDVTEHLHPGSNDLRIVVGNLAINAVSGRAEPSYRLLDLRYGRRFAPQDESDLQPVPAGIFGKVMLVGYAPK